MSDNGGGSPAARALPPPAPSADEGATSGARLATPRPHDGPASIVHPREGQAGASPAADGDWASFATAPTLLLTPPEAAERDDAASTSRIATPSTMPVENPQWFRTGTTIAPPSMRPPAESGVPLAGRAPPDPRVVKIVAGVIGGCLLIVAVAGAKLLYQASTVAPAPTEGPSAPVTPPATTDRENTARSAAENAPAGDPQPRSETTPSNAPLSSAASGAEATRRPPAHSSPKPTRVTVKPRRVPLPKKLGKSTR